MDAESKLLEQKKIAHTTHNQAVVHVSVCPPVYLDLCTYLQQESLVFNNGVLGSKVFVAGKLHRNNGPELRQRRHTHTQTLP